MVRQVIEPYSLQKNWYWKDSNTDLVGKILKAKKETIINEKQWEKQS